MKKLFFIITLSILTGCSNKDKIIGEWERYGDNYEGALVKVEKSGDTYQGIIVSLSGDLKDLGFNIGDVCWKNITEIEKDKYKANVIIKGYDINSNPYIKEADVFLTIENDNTLLVKNYVTDITINNEGKERRYKRIN